jgi:FMN-dependent NADH-azoreductase
VRDLAAGQAALNEFLVAVIVVVGAPMYNFSIPSQPKAWMCSPLASIRTCNDWDDPEADKADKEDKRALLLVFVAMIAICGAAFLLM